MKYKLKLKKRKKVFIDHGKLLDALKDTSQDVQISAPDLEFMIGAVEKKGHNNRNIRTAVTQLIQEGHLIGSGSKGFFMINTMIELATYIHHLRVYINGVEDRIVWIKRAWHHSKKKKLLKLDKED